MWDNLWFGGQYPLASYSLLYYVPASIVGNLPLVFAASVAATLLFASLAANEWGAAAHWPIRAFGVLAAAPLFTGLYAYSLGFVAMLGALRALQARRLTIGILLSGLTLGFSPLAFVFLCLILASFCVGRSRNWRRVVIVAVGLLVAASVQLTVMLLFQSPGLYPFHAIALVAVEGCSALGILLARRAHHGGRPLSAFFALWALGAIVCYLVPTPLGGNWTRLSAFLFPMMLLTAALAQFRPRYLVALALAGALAYNITPYLLLIPYRLDVRPEKAAFWAPALGFLRTHLHVGYRVEVVPTAAHWESYWLPRDGFPLARGFYDQIDAADDPIVYAPHVAAAGYRRWLHSLAVAYVLLPSTQLDRAGGQGEATLLRSGRTGFPVVYRDAVWTIYRVQHATPLITGPGTAAVTRFGHSVISGTVSRPGRYLLRVRYAPYFIVRGGCIRNGPHGMTWLDLRRDGSFRIQAIENALRLLGTTSASASCSAARGAAMNEHPGVR